VRHGGAFEGGGGVARKTVFTEGEGGVADRGRVGFSHVGRRDGVPRWTRNFGGRGGRRRSSRGGENEKLLGRERGDEGEGEEVVRIDVAELKGERTARAKSERANSRAGRSTAFVDQALKIGSLIRRRRRG
jgi:hypothetical protein